MMEDLGVEDRGREHHNVMGYRQAASQSNRHRDDGLIPIEDTLSRVEKNLQRMDVSESVYENEAMNKGSSTTMTQMQRVLFETAPSKGDSTFRESPLSPNTLLMNSMAQHQPQPFLQVPSRQTHSLFDLRSLSEPQLHSHPSQHSQQPQQSQPLLTSSALLDRLRTTEDTLAMLLKEFVSYRSTSLGVQQHLEDRVALLERKLHDRGVNVTTEKRLDSMSRVLESRLHTLEQRHRRDDFSAQGVGVDQQTINSLTFKINEVEQEYRNSVYHLTQEVTTLKGDYLKLQADVSANIGLLRENSRAAQLLQDKLHSLTSTIQQQATSPQNISFAPLMSPNSQRSPFHSTEPNSLGLLQKQLQNAFFNNNNNNRCHEPFEQQLQHNPSTTYPTNPFPNSNQRPTIADMDDAVEEEEEHGIISQREVNAMRERFLLEREREKLETEESVSDLERVRRALNGKGYYHMMA
eukprot:m.30704 g.30704  ORF g.30704 m.30704 type:complete len:464 (-) comp6247_c0_seq1:61-1452(-)